MIFERSLLQDRPHCPVCEAPERSLHLDIDGFRIVRCDKCGFLYVQNVIPADANLEYYSAGYQGERHRQGQSVNASINIQVLRRIPDLRGKRLLDIGSGFGFLLARARDELGMEVVGAELSESERDYANSALGIRTVGDLAELGPDPRFDVVSLFEVIEHILEPAAMIETAAGLLKPGGFLILGTDNFESAAVRAMGAGFPKWIPNQHISLFAPDSLRRIATQTGKFRVFSEGSFTPWEYHARIAVQKLSGGRKGAKHFSLENELGSEESRGFRFFGLRKALNATYSRLARRKDLEGAMMHLILQRV